MSAIDDYLKDVTPPQREALERVRKIATKLIPEVEEVISYGIPTLKYKGKYVIYFAAFKNHMSVFPGAALTSKYKEMGYKTGKGTIQFTEDKPLPEAIIKELVKTRLEMINKR